MELQTNMNNKTSVLESDIEAIWALPLQEGKIKLLELLEPALPTRTLNNRLNKNKIIKTVNQHTTTESFWSHGRHLMLKYMGHGVI